VSKCLRRLSRERRNGLKHLAWDTWVTKVQAIRRKCNQVLSVLVSKRKSSCKFAFDTWHQFAQDDKLRREQVERMNAEIHNNKVTLRLYWREFVFAVASIKAENRRARLLVINKMLARVRAGFDRWYHVAQRLTRLRGIGYGYTRRLLFNLNKRALLAFAKWKTVVWDYHKVYYSKVQQQLSDAHERIVHITEQQLSMETSTTQLKAHNDRADKIARTLYHQVHRMLSTRRLYASVKATFAAWKEHHETIQRGKQRVKQFMLRTYSTAAMKDKGLAFRSWVVFSAQVGAAHREAEAWRQNEELYMKRSSFNKWQEYRVIRKMKMMVSCVFFILCVVCNVCDCWWGLYLL
jgi:hypothetical protein